MVRTVHTGRLAGAGAGPVTAAAQGALLGGLAATVGLSGTGWVAGLGVAAATAAGLAHRPAGTGTSSAPADTGGTGTAERGPRTGTSTAERGPRTAGSDRRAARPLGPADRVTLVRAVLVGAVTALTVDAADRPVPRALLVTLVAVALGLDAVDGWVARRTRTVSAWGARFDMEVDAFLILVLSAGAARAVGSWVLAIGAARYLFGAAGWVWPWMRAALPPRYWRKVAAATQGVALAVVVSGVLPRPAATVVAAVALALLAESFGRDTWWLWRRRSTTGALAGLSDSDPIESGPIGSGPIGSGRAGVEEGHDPAARAGGGRRRADPRAVRARVLTALALLLAWFALVIPDELPQLHPGAFARIPVEGLALVALAAALPHTARRAVAAVAGVLLGLLTVVALLDMGFFAALDRPFNPITDWGNFGPAVGVLADALGNPGASAIVAAAVLLVAAVLVLVALAVLRVAAASARHRTAAARGVVAAGLAWLVCAALGLVAPGGAPVAATSATALAYGQIDQVRAGVADQHTFTRAQHSDPWRAAAGDGLLTGLRGKDVIVAFVESYGRVAVEDPAIGPATDTALRAGTATLRADGYGARSAFLTSPTFGGISWLAHSTLQSGLWIDNQQRYDQLIAGDRFTLSDAFARAGWRTVGDIPSNNQDWPPGRRFYHYDQVLDERNVGYRGPHFAYAAMPDQYVLAAFQRLELAGPHRPVMAEIDLVSSHTPWAPLPRAVPWDQVGDGSVFDPQPAQGRQPNQVWPDPARVKAAYGDSVRYTLSTLVSFLDTFRDRNLVLVVLGDHQPATIVSGTGASHDVPISIISDDPGVLDRISGWGWQDGLLPGVGAPVSRMDTFRDRFLTAYGPDPAK